MVCLKSICLSGGQDELIWERKRDGGFPEAKVLKQRVRDLVWPDRDLGHSDTTSKPE